MFVDKVKIHIKLETAETVFSFRREKYILTATGGDGGNGGSIIFKVNGHAYSDGFSLKKFIALPGEDGRGSKQTGRDGDSTVIEVPPGTIVRDELTGLILADCAPR